MTNKVILLNEYMNPRSAELNATELESDTNTSGKRKHWYLKGVFMQSEAENLNERIYPYSELARETGKLAEQIQRHGMVLGELDHPEDLSVNASNASHAIEELRMRGNDAYGKMRILPDVPSGKIVEGLLKSGVPLGVSSRGTGFVDPVTALVSDFNLITIDIVATPSAQGARPMPIYENLRNTKSGAVLTQSAADCISHNDKHTEALDRDIINTFKNWTYK